MIPFILLLIGFLLVFIEFFVPGGLIGIIGGLFIAASIVLFALQTNSLLGLLLFVLFIAISLWGLIRFALWRIVHAKPGSSIYLHGTQAGYQASSFESQAIGKEGVVYTDLKPGGYILIDETLHQAISLTGYVSKDEKVIVVGGQEESLLVKKKE
ncbi:MAG: NfeD family protein [Parachlamydia sp.]|jgi:membrane-bound serine protease (ClpP class)|nr:NfeD family protein [Parachlamydia sp.]